MKFFGVHICDHATLMNNGSTLNIFFKKFVHTADNYFIFSKNFCVHTCDHTTLMINGSPSFFLFFFKNFFLFFRGEMPIMSVV